MINIPEGTKEFHGRYDSLDEFLLAISEPPPKNKNRNGHNYWRTHRNAEWFGIEKDLDGNGLIKMCREGWDHGAARISESISAMDVARLPSIRRRREWSGAGDEVDMARVYSGRLDTAWRRTRKGEASGNNRIFIMVDSIASGGLDANDMFWRGAAATALGDMLTGAGYSVRMASGFRAKTMNIHDCSLVVTVKPYQSPWTLSDAAATMACPAFFRLLGHLWLTTYAPADDVGCGGVMVERLRDQDAQEYGEEARFQFLASQSISSRETAMAWAKEKIERINNALYAHD